MSYQRVSTSLTMNIPIFKRYVAFNVYISNNSTSGATYDKWEKWGEIFNSELENASCFQETSANGDISLNFASEEKALAIMGFMDDRKVLFERVYNGTTSVEKHNIFYAIESQRSRAINEDTGEDIYKFTINAGDIYYLGNFRKLRNNKYYPNDWDEDTKPVNYMQYVNLKAENRESSWITADVFFKAFMGEELNPRVYTRNDRSKLYGLKSVTNMNTSKLEPQTTGTDCREKTVTEFLSDSNWRTVVFHYLDTPVE